MDCSIYPYNVYIQSEDLNIYRQEPCLWYHRTHKIQERKFSNHRFKKTIMINGMTLKPSGIQMAAPARKLLYHNIGKDDERIQSNEKNSKVTINSQQRIS